MATANLPEVRPSCPPSLRLNFDQQCVPEYGHTLSTWTAVTTCPAAVLAREIVTAMERLIALLRAWNRDHSESSDPGVDAILAAGLALPEYTQTHGTTLKDLAQEFFGLQWVLESTYEPIGSDVPRELPASPIAEPTAA